MEISSLNINNIEKQVFETEPKQMGFRASGVSSLERNPQVDTYAKPKNKTGLWVTLGVIAAAGLAIGFDFWKYKGQHCKNLWNKVKGFFGKETPKPSGESPKPSGESPKITEYSLADFKKNGKFEKGKALLSDGSAYTGTIKHKTDEGIIIEMKYADGELKNVLALKESEPGVTKNLTTSIYNGSVSVETDYLRQNNRSIWHRIKIDEDGNIANIKYEQFNKTRNGEELALWKETDLGTGKIKMGHRVISKPIGYFHDHTHVDGKKIKLEYNDHKKLYSAFDTSFDKNAEVYKNQFYEVNPDKKLIPIDKYRLTNKHTKDRSVFYELDSNGNIINARLLTNRGMSRKRLLSAEEVNEFAAGKILEF